MSITHTHSLAEDGLNNHVDSWGHEFGDAEHAKAWGAAKAAPRDLVEHTHEGVQVSVHETIGGPLWRVVEAETASKTAAKKKEPVAAAAK